MAENNNDFKPEYYADSIHEYSKSLYLSKHNIPVIYNVSKE